MPDDTTTETSGHACSNCDGIDPDTCLMNPDRTVTTPPAPGLRERIAAVFRLNNGQFPAWTKDADPDGYIRAVLAVVQPVIDEVDLLRRGAAERADLLEEARDALSAAGQNGAHGDDWPHIAPSIRALGERAADLATRASQQAELLGIAEHAGNTAEAHRAQLAATLGEVLAQFTQQGHPGAPCLRTPWIRTPTVDRWRTALTPPAPADQTEGEGT